MRNLDKHLKLKIMAITVLITQSLTASPNVVNTVTTSGLSQATAASTIAAAFAAGTVIRIKMLSA